MVWKPFQRLISIGSIGAVLLLVSVLAADSWTGKVVGITDGDTIRILKDGKEVKIRLHGVDTPEEGQPFGTRAKQFTSTLAFGKSVRAEVFESDKYGRSVANIYLEDGRCLNQELVRHGFAWWYQKYAQGDTNLSRLEKEARETQVGLWADKDPIAPWDWRRGERDRRVEVPTAPRGPPTDAPSITQSEPPQQQVLKSSASSASQEIVYRTHTGAKYHRAGCRYLKSIIQTTVGEATTMGLAPCSSCSPPSPSAIGLNQAEVHTPAIPRVSVPAYSGRCQAITKKGTQCKRSAGAGGYCWQHGS